MEATGILLAGYNGLTGSEIRHQAGKVFPGKIFLIGRTAPENLQPQENWISSNLSESSLQSLAVSDCHTLVICLGSTRRKAGSKENFFEIDHHMVLRLAAWAARQGVKNLLFVSSGGANAGSSNFYLRTKGLTEKALCGLGLESVYLFRPMMLNGNRKEFRAGEQIALFFTRLLDGLMVGPLLRFHSTPISFLAACLLHYAIHPAPGVHLLENARIIKEGKKNSSQE